MHDGPLLVGLEDVLGPGLHHRGAEPSQRLPQVFVEMARELQLCDDSACWIEPSAGASARAMRNKPFPIDERGCRWTSSV
jgi:hypothetical protein